MLSYFLSRRTPNTWTGAKIYALSMDTCEGGCEVSLRRFASTAAQAQRFGELGMKFSRVRSPYPCDRVRFLTSGRVREDRSTHWSTSRGLYQHCAYSMSQGNAGKTSDSTGGGEISSHYLSESLGRPWRLSVMPLVWSASPIYPLRERSPGPASGQPANSLT